ncbi:MAG: hypothetical protein II202_06185 [Bacteroidales bacterium]|jgi:hypothetical protein|nr:hypothetical protein [Bacteroidales bacterium]MBQ5827409.1 hypothetical protein [Bacteroidales bacterium]
MKEIDLQGSNFTCLKVEQMQYVMGGTAAVAGLDGLWDYVKKAVDFIMEYHKDIIDGFKRGWNKF